MSASSLPLHRFLPLLLLLAACAAPARMADPEHFTVVVDGRPLHAGETSLLQLLHCCTSALRLGEGTAEDEPMVQVDGVRLVSVMRLAHIPAFHAERVEVLRPTEAVPVYGPRARNGAILVWTRK
jgi:hypothetical protein